MTQHQSRKVAGTLLIVGAIFVNIPYARLISTFEYPDILRAPSADILRQFAAVMAYQMLHRSAKIQQGQRILIHGAGGAVGTALLQPGHLYQILQGRCAVTADTVLWLGRFFALAPTSGWPCRKTTSWTSFSNNKALIWRRSSPTETHPDLPSRLFSDDGTSGSGSVCLNAAFGSDGELNARL